MDREIHVYIDIGQMTVQVGRLWVRGRADRYTASFEYDASWLSRANAFSIDPLLPLTRGQFHTSRPLFNAFRDAAPDSWGRLLMQRNEAAVARRKGAPARALSDIDYLLGVDDEVRLGALRFMDAGGNIFLSQAEQRVPPLIELRRLLGATERILKNKETEEDLKLVLAPGTPLGGARPKALVRHSDGRLFLAKFPRRDDTWPWTRWEAATLALAAKAGIETPFFELEVAASKPILLIARFDRRGVEIRVPFMSALTALNAEDNERGRSYLEIAEAVRRDGASPNRDLGQLWRRIVFNILISNTDDHLRNHGFLHEAAGWRLSPAYDLNPCPPAIRPRVHQVCINEIDPTASLETAISTAAAYGLSEAEAITIAAEVGRVVATWRAVAKQFGLKPSDTDHMKGAFEHDDLIHALALRAPAPAPTRKAKAKVEAFPGRKTPSKPQSKAKRKKGSKRANE
jgi:serine/threonine-protein kinase HipA